MKSTILCFLFLLPVAFLSSQSVKPAPADKAVVYFMRPSATGALINFVFFDGDQVIGRLNGGKYFRYECDPGKHLFWAKSENRSFLDANLEAGKIYIVHAQPMMGIGKAAVQIYAVNPDVDKMKKFQMLLAKKPSFDLDPEKKEQLNTQLEDYKVKGLARSEELREAGKLSNSLDPGMHVEIAELKYVKKKKSKKGK